MNQIKLKSWLVGALILLGLSLIVDYYFIHILFTEKQQHLLRQNEISTDPATTTPTLDN
ncbi:hypothetical protein D3C72_1827710 [compost metagenome]